MLYSKVLENYIKTAKTLILNPEVRKLYLIGIRKQLPNQTHLSNREHIQLGIDWLERIYKESNDGGFPSKVSFINREPINPSYPETTGYILGTLVNYQKKYGKLTYVNFDSVIEFLLKLQFPNGAFPGGHAKMANSQKPSYFNTGQIILGLVNYHQHINASERVKTTIIKTVEWMESEIDSDGYINSKVCYKGYRTYYSRSLYGLLVASRYLNHADGIAAGKRAIDRILKYQGADGWIEKWGFNEGNAVLHTIAYTIRGLIEAGVVLDDKKCFEVAAKATKAILSRKINWQGYMLPSSFYRTHWSGQSSDLCPTGLVQLANCLYKLSKYYPEDKFPFKFEADQLINVVKLIQLRDMNNPFYNGAVSGSWPIQGTYQSWDLVNWSVKFFIDALMLQDGLDPAELDS